MRIHPSTRLRVALIILCSLALSACIAESTGNYHVSRSLRLSLSPAGDELAVGWGYPKGGPAERHRLDGTRVVSSRVMKDWDAAVFPEAPAVVPPEVLALKDDRVVSIVCGTGPRPMCVMARVYSERGGRPTGFFTVVHGERRCDFPDRWRERTGPVISADGRMVAFAASEGLNSPRTIYLVANDGQGCEPVPTPLGPGGGA